MGCPCYFILDLLVLIPALRLEVKRSEVTQSCPTPYDPRDCSLFLSMEFSRQEYWCGLPFPFPWDLPDPGIKPGSPALQAVALPSEPPGKPLHWDWSYPQIPTGKTLLHWHCLPASARGCPSPAPSTGAAFAISVIFHPDSCHLESVSL